MRLVDAMFRGGHLSEGTLIEAVMTGDRPAHLDRCEICAERASEVGRWLEQVRLAGQETADGAFAPEQYTVQHAQIMRRLEQLDHPARVIAFPSQTRLMPEGAGRRIAPAWLGVAAAAGLALGIVGTQVTMRLTGTETAPTAAVQPVSTPAPPPVNGLPVPQDANLIAAPLDHQASDSLGYLEEGVPPVTLVNARAGG